MKVPHTLVLLYGMVLLAYVLTWVLPAGVYETTPPDAGPTRILPGTFHYLEQAPRLPIWSVLTVIPRGLAAAQGIVFFVLIIGGTLAVVRETGMLDAVIGRLLRRWQHRPAWLLFFCMLAFAVGASTFGMAEEAIPMTVILIALCRGLRLDAVTAVGVMVVGGGIGYGAAAINPFTVVMAQDIAGLKLLSGMSFRLIVFGPLLLLGFWHVWRYASKVRRDPGASLMAGLGEGTAGDTRESLPEMTARHWVVLGLGIGALSLLVWGAVRLGWYLTELSALFFGLALVVALVAGRSLNHMAKVFTHGSAELAGTAMIIGVARSIEILLNDGQVLHTVIHGLAMPLTHLGTAFAAMGMFLTQSLLNLVIPSGSGQAYATMPIMAPMADLLGLSRQVAVLAYQMGDGFTNMIIPTNAVLVGILSMAGIPLTRWVRFIWPLVLQLLMAGCLILLLAIWIGYK